MSQAEVDLGYDEYQDVSALMYSDTSYLPALKAAILAPSVFLKDINNFEVTFDAVIHHLEVAFSKAKEVSDIELVKRVAQELFHGHIFLIEQKINYQKALNQRGLMTKIGDLFKGKSSLEEPPFKMPPGLVAVSSKALLKVEAAVFLADYFERLYTEWKISKKREFFYVQLARTYRKVIVSKIYDAQYSLINNTIDRNKVDIINAIIAQQDWDEGIEFVASLDFRKPTFKYSTLKNTFYRGYKKYCMSRNVTSTYFFIGSILISNILLILYSLSKSLGTFSNAMIIILIILLSVFLIRYEHRSLLLRYKISQRVKEMKFQN